MNDDTLGFWADDLNANEVLFCKEIYNIIKENNDGSWDKFLNEPKIIRATLIEKNPLRTASETKQIKAALFENRLAYTFFQFKIPIYYEYSAGIGNSTVDFMLNDTSKWLVELTSLREGKEIKDATVKSGDYYSFLSIDSPNTNSPEVIDIIRSQRLLCSKACNNGEPTKFPLPIPNQFHMIIIDMRSLSGSDPDIEDYINIALGSWCLRNVEHGMHCMSWWENNKRELVKGVFDKRHPDMNCRIFQERIHAIGFIAEKNYTKDEIKDELVLIGNPRYFTSKEHFISILPTGFKTCRNIFIVRE